MSKFNYKRISKRQKGGAAPQVVLIQNPKKKINITFNLSQPETNNGGKEYAVYLSDKNNFIDKTDLFESIIYFIKDQSNPNDQYIVPMCRMDKGKCALTSNKFMAATDSLLSRKESRNQNVPSTYEIVNQLDKLLSSENTNSNLSQKFKEVKKSLQNEAISNSSTTAQMNLSLSGGRKKIELQGGGVVDNISKFLKKINPTCLYNPDCDYIVYRFMIESIAIFGIIYKIKKDAANQKPNIIPPLVPNPTKVPSSVPAPPSRSASNSALAPGSSQNSSQSSSSNLAPASSLDASGPASGPASGLDVSGGGFFQRKAYNAKRTAGIMWDAFKVTKKINDGISDIAKKANKDCYFEIGYIQPNPQQPGMAPNNTYKPPLSKIKTIENGYRYYMHCTFQKSPVLRTTQIRINRIIRMNNAMVAHLNTINTNFMLYLIELFKNVPDFLVVDAEKKVKKYNELDGDEPKAAVETLVK